MIVIMLHADAGKDAGVVLLL